jgi:hypothetical protein
MGALLGAPAGSQNCKLLKVLVGERGFEFLSRELLILAELLQVSDFKMLTTFDMAKHSHLRTHLDTKLRETYRRT